MNSLLEWRAPWPSLWSGRLLRHAASAARGVCGRLCRRCAMARLRLRPPSRVALNHRRSDKIAGRVAVATVLLSEDAPAPMRHLFPLNLKPTEHGSLPACCSLAFSACASALTNHPVRTHVLRRLCRVHGDRLRACGRQDGRARCQGRGRALRHGLSTAYGGYTVQKVERMRSCLCACAHSVYMF